MGSGGGAGKSQQTTTQTIDPTLQPLYAQTAGMTQDIQQQMPGFGQFFGAAPQQIPGLTGGQQNVLAQYGARAFGSPFNAYDIGATPYAQAAGAGNAAEAQALGQIGYFAGGPIGSAQATQEAMAAARTPALNELAMAGLGNSDAIGTSLTGAYAPILAQEMAIRAGVIPQLASIGAQQRGGQQFASQFLANQGAQFDTRTGQNLSAYNAAEEGSRQVEAQRGQAELADFMRRQGLGSQFTTGILSGLPSLVNTSVVGKTSGGGK